jgi:hypothetical protein
LCRFIDGVMARPETRERRFWQEITAYHQAEVMSSVTIAEPDGGEEGRQEGLLAGIEACLKLKFGAEGLRLMPELRELKDPQRLRAVLEAIPDAVDPGVLRRLWARRSGPEGGTRS